MGHPPPSSEDLQQLKLLALFHYILAGIMALFACFPLIHVVLGILMVSGSLDGQSGTGNAPPKAFGIIFTAVGCAFVAAGWALAAAMFVAGKSIAKRRRHTFCVVVAGVSCTFMPLGTALGVFSLIVLMRPQVKALFEPVPDPDS